MKGCRGHPSDSTLTWRNGTPLACPPLVVVHRAPQASRGALWTCRHSLPQEPAAANPAGCTVSGPALTPQPGTWGARKRAAALS